MAPMPPALVNCSVSARWVLSAARENLGACPRLIVFFQALRAASSVALAVAQPRPEATASDRSWYVLQLLLRPIRANSGLTSSLTLPLTALSLDHNSLRTSRRSVAITWS